MRVFLESERLQLRPLEIADVDGVYPSWFDDAEVCRYNGHHIYPYSNESLKTFVEATWDNRTTITLAIIDKESSEHIGNIALQNIDYIARQAGLSFIIGDKAYWGKGVGREAGQLIIRHAFLTLNLNRIYLGTTHNNEAMNRLAQKLGFKQEGCRRQAAFKEGEYLDIYEYGLLKDEWSAI